MRYLHFYAILLIDCKIEYWVVAVWIRRKYMKKTNTTTTKKVTRNYTKKQFFKIAKHMVRHENATREDLAEFFGLSSKRVLDKMRLHYANLNNFHTYFFDLLKENEKNANEEIVNIEDSKNVLAGCSKENKKDGFEISDVEADVTEVIVVETGYLLSVGVAGLLEQSLDIYMPLFCLRELEKMATNASKISNSNTKTARELLTVIHSTHRINFVNLKEEVLFEEPNFELRKLRSYGVVSLCCHLYSHGKTVRLLSNSQEIDKLAELQCAGFIVG